MKPGPLKPAVVKPGRAGNAGIVASFAIALAGVVLGAVSAYFSEYGAGARAARVEALAAASKDGAPFDQVRAERDKAIQRVLTDGALERLPVPSRAETAAPDAPRPKVIIILDDMGLDRRAAERIMNLPGPLTLSFLPYARDVDVLAGRARAAGNEIMLHLPMEPQGDNDPGPNALKLGMTGAEFIKNLDWNLSRFDGYDGVNNHMGSRLTTDRAAMKTVLAYLRHKGLFFIDSVTTGDTIVREAGADVGAQVFERDVFLDAETGSAEAVKAQLQLVERIALETGYAVAIGHPHETTINALGPWLTSAPARGFEIAPVSALVEIYGAERGESVLAAAPALRL